MAKQIRVSDDVYKLLLEMQRPRETFSKLIQRLLTASVLLSKIEPLIRGQPTELQEQFAKGLNAKKAD